jgi:CBS domain containing-hemolysin-like protein
LDPAHALVSFLLQSPLSATPEALGLTFAAQGLLLVVLLLLSAVFSGSEVALFSIQGSLREQLSDADDAASDRILQLLETPRQLLITILLLNTVVNVSAAILAAVMTAQVALTYNLNYAVIVVVEVIVLAFVLLVISEITPKLIATKHAVAYSRRISGVMTMLVRVFSPLTRLIAGFTQRLQQRFTRANGERLSPEDLRAIAEIGEAHGSIEEDERNLIDSIVEFGETTVREVMVSRLDVVALPVTSTLEEALATIRASGHSRLPLYVDHLDNILGIVYAKDLLPYLDATENGSTPASGDTASHNTAPADAASKDASSADEASSDTSIDWTSIAREPMFVPLGRTLDDVLTDFQTKKTHMAVVVDEYGGTAGLLTLENVLEEIVGDIRDEHDDEEDETLLTRVDQTTYQVDARINLDTLGEHLGIELDEQDFDFETLGGLVYHLAGDIPQVDNEYQHRQLRLRVESVNNRRIGEVRIDVLPEEEVAAPSPGEPQNK